MLPSKKKWERKGKREREWLSWVISKRAQGVHRPPRLVIKYGHKFHVYTRRTLHQLFRCASIEPPHAHTHTISPFLSRSHSCALAINQYIHSLGICTLKYTMYSVRRTFPYSTLYGAAQHIKQKIIYSQYDLIRTVALRSQTNKWTYKNGSDKLKWRERESRGREKLNICVKAVYFYWFLLCARIMTWLLDKQMFCIGRSGRHHHRYRRRRLLWPPSFSSSLPAFATIINSNSSISNVKIH